MDDLRLLNKEILRKANDNEPLYCQNDDEFMYMCGLVVRYALRIGAKGSPTNGDKIHELIRQAKVNPSKFKDKVLFIHRHYGGKIDMENRKYSRVLAAVAGYEIDNPKKLNDNAFFLATISKF